MSDYPISGATPQGRWCEAHCAAMRAAGWLPFDVAQVGDRVLVSLDNGYETWGTVTKVYKNGSRRVAPDGGGKSTNRSPCMLWRKP